jgi:hypothetical protein
MLEECPEHGEQDVISDHAAYVTWDRESGVQILVMELMCGCWLATKLCSRSTSTLQRPSGASAGPAAPALFRSSASTRCSPARARRKGPVPDPGSRAFACSEVVGARLEPAANGRQPDRRAWGCMRLTSLSGPYIRVWLGESAAVNDLVQGSLRELPSGASEALAPDVVASGI